MEEGELLAMVDSDPVARSSETSANSAVAQAEQALKFRITVKGCDAGLFKALEIAGDSEVEVDMNEVVHSNIMERSMDNPPSERSSIDHAPVGCG